MNEFEKACSELEKDENYETDVENCIEWLRGSDRATVTFSQGRYIIKIEKLAEKHPDEVQIIHRNYNRGGNVSSIVAHIPVSYIKINNTKRELTEEERAELRERAKSNFGYESISRENP